MRKYVIPANPQTTDQTTQRNAMTACVLAWRTYFTNALERSAWNRTALASGKPMSGFNAFVKSTVKIILGNPDASYALSAAKGAAYIVNFTMKNLDDGTTGDEAGNFEVWHGSEPNSLLLHATPATIVAGTAATAAMGAAPATVYVKLRKDGQDRTGIEKITIAA
jgi:hypothetical protein